MAPLTASTPRKPVQSTPARLASRRPADGHAARLAAAVALLLVAGGRGRCLGPPTEYEVKAAFIVNFTRFVEWPSDAFGRADAPFVIGILGRDPFGGSIDRAVKGKTVGSHPVVVRRLRTVPEAKGCHIVFVCSSEVEHAPHIVAAGKGLPVLTVGDWQGFAQHGGMISLVAERDRVRIEVNAEAAQHARLTISARLLGIAKVVKDSGT